MGREGGLQSRLGRLLCFSSSQGLYRSFWVGGGGRVVYVGRWMGGIMAGEGGVLEGVVCRVILVHDHRWIIVECALVRTALV